MYSSASYHDKDVLTWQEGNLSQQTGFVWQLWGYDVGDSGEMKEGGCCLPVLTFCNVEARVSPADGAAR